MERVFRTIVLQMLVFLLTSCTSSIRIVNESIDRPGDLTNATTYRWDKASLATVAPAEVAASEFIATIRNEIDLALAARGFRKVDDGPADMTMGFRVTIEEKVAKYNTEVPYYDLNYTSPYGIRWRFGNRERSVIVEQATLPVEVTFFEEGTLHIGAFDTNNQMGWHVSAHKIINKKHTPSQHAEVLKKTVRAIMERFPVHRSLPN